MNGTTSRPAITGTMNGTTSRPAITATGLRRSYGEHLVLDGLDLGVPEGTIFALLGPNGAGKTTAVKSCPP